ncbi:hypothetical protein OU5_P0270 (plasmid) [Pseudomonas mandelii JR-1]|uniref:Uncharacterized protein n=1 Tax=Pseudomonas mandelii JR-1 TaxID=1147786 RepID=A0A024EL50_9PSED|nr:hypothetical protein OU5_P0270 [Pseudomonas mandelii JR-1]
MIAPSWSRFEFESPQKRNLRPHSPAFNGAEESLHSLSTAGEIDMVTAGRISPVSWEDERGCWESEDSAVLSKWS